MILKKKGSIRILFVLFLTFSFIVSSCGVSEKQDTKLKLLTNSSDQTTVECNEELYGDACNNLDDFVLVKRDEIQPEYIKEGTSIAGVEGTLVEENYDECSEEGQTGCLATDTYKAIKLSEHTSKIISTENILGVSGSFVVPATSSVLSGTSYGVNGSLSGSLANCSGNDSGCFLRSYSQGVNSLQAIDYDDLYSKRSNIKNGYTLISGITGTQSECSDGGSSCYINGASFKAAETSKLVATNIKNGIVLGGVTGSYTGDYSNCSGSLHEGCIAVAEYPSVPSGLTSSLLSTASINGVNGSITECSSGGSLCYVGASFKAAESEKLIAANIKNSVSLGGVTGNYPSQSSPLTGASNTTDLVTSNFTELMISSSSFEWFDSAGNRYTGSGSSDIVPENIRNGVDIFGVVGTYGDPL